MALSLVVIVGCSAGTASTAPSSAAATTPPASTGGSAAPSADASAPAGDLCPKGTASATKAHYVFIVKSMNLGGNDLVKTAGERRLKELNDCGAEVSWDYIGPSTADPAQQVQMIEAAVQAKATGIIISALSPAVCDAVTSAVDAGTPVITFDSDCPDSKRLTYVGADNHAGGVIMAQLYADWVKKNKPAGEKQKIVILTGKIGATNLMERDQGFKDQIAKEGIDYEIVNTVTGEDDINKSVDVVESTLLADPTLNGFYFDGPWPILVDQSNLPNLTQRVKDGMTVVSFDGIQPEMDALRSDLVRALVAQDYYGFGYQSVQVIDQIARFGGKFDAVTNLPLVVITKDGGPTAAGDSITAAAQDQHWDTGDWPETPIVAPNLK